MGGKLVTATGALLLALAGSAQAETYCVDVPACDGETRATVQQALDAAAAGDVVQLGARTYDDGPFSGGDAVEVVGAGRGATGLTADAGAAPVLALTAAGSAVSDLTV